MKSFTAILLLALVLTTAHAEQQLRRTANIFTPPAGFNNPVHRSFNPSSDPTILVTYKRESSCETFHVPCCDCADSSNTCSYYVCDLDTQTNLCVDPDSSLLSTDVDSEYQKFGCGTCVYWEKEEMDIQDFGGFRKKN